MEKSRKQTKLEYENANELKTTSKFYKFFEASESDGTQVVYKVFTRDTFETYYDDMQEMFAIWKTLLGERFPCVQLKKVQMSNNKTYFFMPKYTYTLRTFLQESKEAYPNLRIILEGIIKSMIEAQKHKLVLLKLDLDHIFVSDTYKSYIGGIKYFRRIDSVCPYKADWIVLPKNYQDKNISVLCFGEMLAEIKEITEKAKDNFRLYKREIRFLEDLIQKCCNKDSQKRISFENVLEHKFMKINANDDLWLFYPEAKFEVSANNIQLKKGDKELIIWRIPGKDFEEVKDLMNLIKVLNKEEKAFSFVRESYCDQKEKYYYEVTQKVNNVMTLGQFVKERMDKKSWFKKEEIRKIIRKVGDAILELHKSGIALRCINPDSILVMYSKNNDISEIFLGDIALHRQLLGIKPTVDASKFLYLGKDIGSITYKAKPEDKKADVWLFGALIYYIATGDYCFEESNRKPFDNILHEHIMEKNPEENSMAEIQREQPTSFASELAQLLHDCLDTDEVKRLNMTVILNGPLLNSSEALKEKYTKEKSLGKGGYGQVWKCKRFDGTAFAMKIMSTSEGMRKYVNREIANLKFCHECEFIVKYECDFFQDGNHAVLIEELLNMDLEKYMKTKKNMHDPEKTKKNKFLSPEDMKLTAWSIANAVAFLHQGSIMHRDIKPLNILVSVDEQTNLKAVKLADLGFSKDLREKTKMTELGTDTYKAPEIPSGRYEPSVDIYSYGITLYELCVGKVDRLSKYPLENRAKMMETRMKKKGIDEKLQKLILKCVIINVKERIKAQAILKEDYFIGYK